MFTELILIAEIVFDRHGSKKAGKSGSQANNCSIFSDALLFCCCRLALKTRIINPLNPELNPVCYLLALLGAHHFLHVSRIRVKLLTFRLLMSYIYMEHPFLMFLDYTQRRSTVGRTPLDE